jgi:hypothetical protein
LSTNSGITKGLTGWGLTGGEIGFTIGGWTGFVIGGMNGTSWGWARGGMTIGCGWEGIILGWGLTSTTIGLVWILFTRGLSGEGGGMTTLIGDGM